MHTPLSINKLMRKMSLIRFLFLAGAPIVLGVAQARRRRLMKQFPQAANIRCILSCRECTFVPSSWLCRDDADAPVRRPHVDGPRLDAVTLLDQV